MLLSETRAMVPTLPDDPVVTVAIPMLDEIDSIGACLDSFAAQDFPKDRLELLVIDGGSTDGSRAYVEDRAASEPWIRVVDNPSRSAAAAFNVGARFGSGDVVCLFSSHGVPAHDYVSRSVHALQETGAVGVGGRYLHLGLDPVSNAIGAAMVSPFGMASSHRFASARRDVDTISHPAYVRSCLLDVGGFDETLARNSDYEINIRLRRMGHRLVLDPAIESIYRPRPSLVALSKQFWHYGRWKARVARRHPKDLKPRHLAAPFMVAGGAVSPLLLRSSSGRIAVAVASLIYSSGCGIAAIRAHTGRSDLSTATLLAAFPTMHVSWGAGFVRSVVEDTFGRMRSRANTRNPEP